MPACFELVLVMDCGLIIVSCYHAALLKIILTFESNLLNYG